MGENNNQIKINLTSVVILVLIVVIIIAGLAFIKWDNTKNNKNTIQLEDKKMEQETSYTDTDFSFKFLKMENNKKNIVYSPLSIKYALQMLNDGANGNTKKQIENVIGNTSLTKYDNIKDVLSLGNAIYIRNTYSQYVKDEYTNKLLNKYNAEVKYDEFENAKNINSWIENKTLGQIKNMLRDEIVANPDVEMVLINALAIDMGWKDKFDEMDTKGDTFYLENGDEMQATMMKQKTHKDCVSYYKANNITAISMDLDQYENEQLEFVAIMPNNDLSSYIEKFDMDTLKNITNNLTLASETKNGVNISIPKFSFDYDLNLKADLEKLGITDAFSQSANFSNMSSRALKVGEALHKANIDFSEEGVKASAATVFFMADMALAIENEPIEVEINKPFMYVIRDKKTNEIWFTGAVYEPNSWETDKVNYENK